MSTYFLDDGLGLPDDFNINPSDNVRTKKPILDNSKFGAAYLSSALDSETPMYTANSLLDKEIVVTASRLPNKNLKNLKRKKLLDDLKKQSQEKRRANYFYLAGLGYLGDGQRQKAKDMFEEVNKLNPSHLWANIELYDF